MRPRRPWLFARGQDLRAPRCYSGPIAGRRDSPQWHRRISRHPWPSWPERAIGGLARPVLPERLYAVALPGRRGAGRLPDSRPSPSPLDEYSPLYLLALSLGLLACSHARRRVRFFERAPPRWMARLSAPGIGKAKVRSQRSGVRSQYQEHLGRTFCALFRALRSLLTAWVFLPGQKQLIAGQQCKPWAKPTEMTRLVAGPWRSSAGGAGGYLASNSQRLMLRGGSASVLGNSLMGVSTISSSGFFPGSLSASRFGAAIRHILPAP